ncbi:MAG: hypothetical protein ABW277_06920 [Longimicrobiaceae bacterium]
MVPLPSSALAPLVDEVVYWIQHQVRTMDDRTFMLSLVGVIVVMWLVMAGLRPRR